jgi:putative endopeptidase
MKNLSIIIIIAFLSVACSSTTSEKKDYGYDVSFLNDTVSPCENFFAYTASKWIHENPIPETESRWGSFNILIEENNKRLKSLLEKLEQGTYEVGSAEHTIKTIYLTAMDSNAIETIGAAPIKEQMEAIAKVTSLKDLSALTGQLHRNGLSPLFSFSVSTDEKNSAMNTVNFWQDGLGLPDRDYYFRDGARAEKLRASYNDFINKLFSLYYGEEKDFASIIFNIESKIADKSNTRVENRQPELTYNKMTMEELKEMFPAFDLEAYLVAFNCPKFDHAVVGQPHFFAGISQLLNEVSLDDWKIYYEWNLIRGYAQQMSSDYVQAAFDFYGTALRGKKKMSPRWKKSLGFVNGTTGELLGQIYVKDYFDESSKQRLNTMVENLRNAYAERIKHLEWMSEETKAKALKKISTFTKKIGYPDVWRSYEGLSVTKGDHFANVLALRQFSFDKMLEDIGQPTDKNRWFMSPQTVNAYYDPTKNEVVFPAGILQSPFYTAEADDAINYGSIGVVIGHEFTHGFDDQGSKYDEKGNLNDWWTADDRTKFEGRTKVLVEQFNEMTPMEGYNVNGELTLGENIADLGGLIMAYNAYIKSMDSNEPRDIDGFNYKQRFFLGYARLWRSAITDEALIQRLQTDPHAPADARVNGPLKNLAIFQDAWGCSDSNAMVLPEAEKVNIW